MSAEKLLKCNYLKCSLQNRPFLSGIVFNLDNKNRSIWMRFFFSFTVIHTFLILRQIEREKEKMFLLIYTSEWYIKLSRLKKLYFFEFYGLSFQWLQMLKHILSLNKKYFLFYIYPLQMQGCARFPKNWTFFMWTQRNLEFRHHRKWSLNRQFQC